ncbi:MAG: FkbM family methyltransferase, partial [Cyclobacteriaceae bacterium]|nr:FkbM family methyltransferase [Cyclobacteriaceae bacterium]
MFVPNNSLWCFEGGDYYEKNVIYWLDKIFEKLEQPIMYNVGANYGYYIIRFADRCKLCCAFEPVGSVYSILEQNIRTNSLKNVRLIKKGVSNKVGDSIIYTYSSDLNSSLFQRTIPREH